MFNQDLISGRSRPSRYGLQGDNPLAVKESKNNSHKLNPHFSCVYPDSQFMTGKDHDFD